MDNNILVRRIYNDIIFNPACFNFSEEEARKKGLWTDSRAMPSKLELDEEQAIVISEESAKDSSRQDASNRKSAFLVKSPSAITLEELAKVVQDLMR